MKFIVGIVIAVAMVCGVYTTNSITESIDKTSNNTVSTQTDNNYNKRILGGWESSASGDLIMYLIMIIHTIGMKVPVI